MGIAFSVVAVAMLVGTPIEGALLGQNFEWWKAIVFCGVCSFGFSPLCIRQGRKADTHVNACYRSAYL